MDNGNALMETRHLKNIQSVTVKNCGDSTCFDFKLPQLAVTRNRTL